MTTAPAATELDWEAIARTFVHGIAIRILELLGESQGPLSPKDISNITSERLGNVSYHVRQLLKHGFIELVDTQPRRGAVEHFYRATRP